MAGWAHLAFPAAGLDQRAVRANPVRGEQVIFPPRENPERLL